VLFEQSLCFASLVRVERSNVCGDKTDSKIDLTVDLMLACANDLKLSLAKLLARSN
jgi:hypothetical protein